MTVNSPSTVELPFVMELNFIVMMTAVMMLTSLSYAKILHTEYYRGILNQTFGKAVSILAIIGGIALVGSIVTLSASVSVESFLKKSNLRATCNIVTVDKIKANTNPPRSGVSPRTPVSTIPGFSIAPADNVRAGMGKISEVNRYLKELTQLAAIPVGLALVTLLRYVFSSTVTDVYQRLFRVCASAVLVSGAILALLSSHNLIFSVITAQVSILGAGMAFCYDDFATIYLHGFYIAETAAVFGVAAVAVFPEGLRLKYSED